MKRNVTFWSIVAILCISLFGLIGTSKVEAATAIVSTPETKALTSDDLDAKKEEIAKQIKIYGENGEEIHPYTLEELKDMIRLTGEQPEDNPIKVTRKTFKSGSFNFYYNYWLGGGTYGKAFKNPITLFVTPSGTAKPFSIIIVYDKNGGPGSQAQKVSLPGGWVGEMHFNVYNMKRGKKYRFKFVNDGSSSTNVKIKTASLWYD
ncbi:hypothetical protein ABE068_18355 [Bacillus glycinifermentans]|uniref:Uncharacterized protein n=1 Tax=Bacillus glycinifermentans TaxID=1664069 RepID=A0A0T6BQ35_9BACI|nr:hypothetical protein [Bacillus glycinifermentans]KRT93762.1 hypothetical protein AB447_216770 [Bacillus glycinifermentans]MEC0487326.1 hypothetical protein [Bacillus glycinifermentans]